METMKKRVAGLVVFTMLMSSLLVFGCSPSSSSDSASKDSSANGSTASTSQASETLQGCLVCHGAADYHELPADHESYTGTECLGCHKVQGAEFYSSEGAPLIPHAVGE